MDFNGLSAAWVHLRTRDKTGRRRKSRKLTHTDTHAHSRTHARTHPPPPHTHTLSLTHNTTHTHTHARTHVPYMCTHALTHACTRATLKKKGMGRKDSRWLVTEVKEKLEIFRSRKRRRQETTFSVCFYTMAHPRDLFCSAKSSDTLLLPQRSIPSDGLTEISI